MAYARTSSQQSDIWAMSEMASLHHDIHSATVSICRTNSCQLPIEWFKRWLAYLNIVNLQDQGHCLCSQLQSGRRDQQGLYDFFIQDIGDDSLLYQYRITSLNTVEMAYLLYVDTRVPFSHGVLVPQFRNDRNWVQARILGQCSWNNFECFCVCLETVCFLSFEGVGVLRQ
jgi:hypothetical protein